MAKSNKREKRIAAKKHKMHKREEPRIDKKIKFY
jgi:hypothetical protein